MPSCRAWWLVRLRFILWDMRLEMRICLSVTTEWVANHHSFAFLALRIVPLKVRNQISFGNSKTTSPFMIYHCWWLSPLWEFIIMYYWGLGSMDYVRESIHSVIERSCALLRPHNTYWHSLLCDIIDDWIWDDVIYTRLYVSRNHWLNSISCLLCFSGLS